MFCAENEYIEINQTNKCFMLGTVVWFLLQTLHPINNKVKDWVENYLYIKQPIISQYNA